MESTRVEPPFVQAAGRSFGRGAVRLASVFAGGLGLSVLLLLAVRPIFWLIGPGFAWATAGTLIAPSVGPAYIVAGALVGSRMRRERWIRLAELMGVSTPALGLRAAPAVAGATALAALLIVVVDPIAWGAVAPARGPRTQWVVVDDALRAGRAVVGPRGEVAALRDGRVALRTKEGFVATARLDAAGGRVFDAVVHAGSQGRWTFEEARIGGAREQERGPMRAWSAAELVRAADDGSGRAARILSRRLSRLLSAPVFLVLAAILASRSVSATRVTFLLAPALLVLERLSDQWRSAWPSVYLAFGAGPAVFVLGLLVAVLWPRERLR